jgi:hypothetical protein
MSNNKQTMKLYTEEQVREMIVLSKYVRNITNEELLSDFTPIELPSDEEIHIHASDYSNNYYEFRAGAKWMRDKIQGGNNEQQ